MDDRGDFQTPDWLARRVAALAPPGARAIVEPTCGRGSILGAALGRSPDAVGLGVDIDPGHVAAARALVPPTTRLETGDVFTIDWAARLAELPQPISVVGNPPWVTNAALGRVASTNLPAKSTEHLAGGDPRTGASNFDVCEWIMLALARALGGRDGSLAMLCKTQVARRVLAALWRDGPAPAGAEMFAVDAREAWGVAVDACLLVVSFSAAGGAGIAECRVYGGLERSGAPARFGLRDGELVSDLDAYDRYRHLCDGDGLRWRSGIKHDCAAIMELDPARAAELEPEVVYPMLKSAELFRGDPPSRFMLVPHTGASGDPARLAVSAPRAWAYLEAHGERLDRRKSRVYRNRPRFSVFGVGPYSFAPWKVAISGFYKQLVFRVVGPTSGRPVVFDDTCYFAPFDHRAAAETAHRLLMSEPAQALYRSLAFWDAKRPITARLLGRLDPAKVAACLAQGSHQRPRTP